ncbi:MAG: hypothetical protein GX610_00940 [Rhodococcus sp.]|nr:hypothetical protein [Rhodococcus sp. (in: high G+C Gram-positive bacteria)]
MKRTLSALDRIQSRLESELDSVHAVSDKELGYRAGIAEAIAHVMEARAAVTARN